MERQVTLMANVTWFVGIGRSRGARRARLSRRLTGDLMADLGNKYTVALAIRDSNH